MFYLLAVLFLVACALAGAIVVSFPFFLQRLAKENILFTAVEEGTVKAVMRGNSFDRFIMSFAGYHLNDSTKPWYKEDKPMWEVLYHGKDNDNGFTERNSDGENEQRDDYYDRRNPLLKHLGLYWVGWPWANSIYVYAFEWNETSTGKEGKEKILPRAEATDFIYVSDFIYAIATDGAETKDRLPTDELTLVTVAVRNPYRALFSGVDWMLRITAAINRLVRNFVGNKTFQDLISTKDFTAFSAPIIELNEKLPDDIGIGRKPPYGLLGRYGVEIRTADLQTIELSGEAKKLDQEATTKEYVAKQEAKATLLKGKAEAAVTEIKGVKEAAALSARLEVIGKHGETGIRLAGYDAMQETSKGPGNTIVWANNPLAPLAEILNPSKTKEKEGGES